MSLSESASSSQPAPGVHVAGISDAENVLVINSTFNIQANGTVDHDIKKLREIADWLTPINFRTVQMDTFSKHASGTGIWFIESPEFQKWFSRNFCLLWGKGMPGAGKTILSSIVIDHLQTAFSTAQDIAIVFAYCRYTDRYSVADILVSFVKQLTERHPSILPSIEPMYTHHRKEATRPGQQELLELLHKLFGLFKKAFIVIDALDEVSDDTRGDLLKRLLSLQASLLLTSRPLDSFKYLLPDAVYIHVESQNHKDIELYIDRKIMETDRLTTLLRGNEALGKQIRTKLKENSKGMFLVAALQIESLKHRTTIKKLREAIESLPSGINDMYQTTWTRIKAQTEEEVSLAMRAIIWLAHANRSLTITELQHALAVAETFDEEDIAQEELIISVSCGLIVVDERSRTVRLVHHTAHDFFRSLASGLSWRPHTLITKSCVIYLSAFKLADRKISDWEALTKCLQTGPLLDYAYHHWGYHAKGCHEEGSLPNVVFSYLLPMY